MKSAMIRTPRCASRVRTFLPKFCSTATDFVSIEIQTFALKNFMLFLLSFLISMKKGDVDILGRKFENWNIIGLISVCILVCLVVAFCMQMCFKPKRKAEAVPVMDMVGQSILEDE